MPRATVGDVVDVQGARGLHLWHKAGLLAWGDSGLPRREAARRDRLGLRPDDPPEAFGRSALLTVVREHVSGAHVVQVVHAHAGGGVAVRGSRQRDRSAATLAEAMSSFPDLVRLRVGERVEWSTRRHQDRQAVQAALTCGDPKDQRDLNEAQKELWDAWRYEDECGHGWHEEVPATLDGERLMGLQATSDDWALLPHIDDLLEQWPLVETKWDSSTYAGVGNAGSGSFALYALAPGQYLQVQVEDWDVQDSHYFTDDGPLEIVVAEYLRDSGTEDGLLRSRPDLVADHRLSELREDLDGDDFTLSDHVDEKRVVELVLPPEDRRQRH